MKTTRVLVASGLALVMVASLAACSSDDWADDWFSGSDAWQESGTGYISGDGRVLELSPEERGEVAAFSGPLDIGGQLSSDTLRGSVIVLNFWYAGCPPCRLEAKDLEELHQEFLDEGVTFLGINVRDHAETSLAFAETYGVTYPSILDIQKAEASLAFSGVVPANSVPTTLVLDREGRVSSRVLGLIDPSILRALIKTAVAEETVAQ